MTLRIFPILDPQKLGPVHESLTADQIATLRATLKSVPRVEDCIGCGTCCKQMPCGGGYRVTDLDGKKTCDKLVEVDRVNDVPQYRCLVFREMIEGDTFAMMCLEPGRGCDFKCGTIAGLHPERLTLLQGLQKRAGLEVTKAII